MKRKKVAENTGSGPKVNSAPSLGPSESTTEDREPISTTDARPDLVGMLKDQFRPGPAVTSRPSDEARAESKKSDDYAKFMEEMSDIL